MARQRYSSGLVDFQTVLETQRNQFATDDSVASSSAQVGLNLVRLFAALGGGWRSDAADDEPSIALAGGARPDIAKRR
jgi:outer membrane protein TolC